MKKLKTIELNRLTSEDYKNVKKTSVIVVLDNIRSQHNIGSVFRTADAFRVESIHLCGISATPPNREIHKTALGATESVKWQYFQNTLDSIKHLRDLNYSIYAVEQTDESINLVDFSIDNHSKTALIFGNEVEGVSSEILPYVDGCIEIPQYGTKHSLNISVSAAIVIWEITKPVLKTL